MPDSKPLILVDGSSYLFRAFHALPPLVNSRGQATGAVKGVINMIRALLKEYPHSPIAIVFDAKGKTFRSDIYTEYKAHRPPMPDELRSQIEPIHEIVRAMGLPLLVVPEVEADDVIGTLADRASRQQQNTLISTGDKDLAQLVNEHVTLINTMTSEVLDPDSVLSKFGVRPDQIIDFLALTGDKADNIPGVPSVGPKTAVKWLNEYDNKDQLIENAEAIGGKIGEKLRENIEQLRLSYELATIKLDVPLDIEIEDLKAGEPDQVRLMELFTDLEFKSWIKELEEAGVAAASQSRSETSRAVEQGDDAADETAGAAPDLLVTEASYRLIDSEDGLSELMTRLQSAEQLAVGIEAEDAHFMGANIIGLSLCCALGEAYYIPLGHSTGQQLEADAVLDRLRPLFESLELPKLGYDLKRVGHLLANHNISLRAVRSDVLIQSYVLNSVMRHGLDDLCRSYLELNPIDPESLLGKGRSKKVLQDLPPDAVLEYAAQKIDYSWRLAALLGHELKRAGKLAEVYRYFEQPLVETLRQIERNGIRLDSSLLEIQSEELAGQLEEIQTAVFELAGEEFNLGSPKQLQRILFEKMELPVIKKTKTGQPSTAEPILQEMAEQHEMPRRILEHRSLSKLKSTYTDKLPLQVRPETGRIHSSFQQAVAATGRLSSTEPNLQNIPIRTAAGRRIRQAFVPEKGYKLMAADYSQVELRIMAHLSADPSLLAAFNSDEDVHRATAADVFGLALEEVTPEQRRSAKAINFGLIYGMSAFGLANQLKVSRADAQGYVDRYFDKYPGVRKYMDETQALADEKGYVETIFGRRLYLPDIHAGNAILRKAAQRTAINAPMQGSAADIIKRAMIDISNWLGATDLRARMLLQVHDELVFEVHPDDLQLLTDGVRFRMMSAAALDVPLIVDVGVGENWDEAH